MNIQQRISKNRFDVYLGCILALLAAVGTAVADIVPKSILGDNTAEATISPIVFVTIVFAVNAGLFCIRKKSHSKIARNHMFAIIGAGIAEAIGIILYCEGLKSTLASDASIISNSQTLFGIILAMIIFHEIIKRKEIFPMILILIGTILLPMGLEFSQNSAINIATEGNMLIIASSVVFAIDIVLYRYISQNTKYDFVKIMQISCVAGAVFCAGALVFFEDISTIQIPTYDDISIILFSGIFGLACPHYCF